MSDVEGWVDTHFNLYKSYDTDTSYDSEDSEDSEDSMRYKYKGLGKHLQLAPLSDTYSSSDGDGDDDSVIGSTVILQEEYDFLPE